MGWQTNAIVIFTLICTTQSDGIGGNESQRNCPDVPKKRTQNELVDAVNDFGFKLMQTLMKQNQNANIVVSPASVSGILAMLTLGSVGKTRDELAQTIGFSQDFLEIRNDHRDFGSVLQLLNHKNDSSKTVYANAVIVDAQEQLRDGYRNGLMQFYKGDAFSTDFGQTDEARRVINEWVKDHTEGKIEDFLQHPLPAATKAVLLSALYFRGQWAYPFKPKYTKKMKFTRPSDEIIADLMYNDGHYDFIFSAEDNLRMVAFPYNDTMNTMYVVLPQFPDRMTIMELLNSLDNSKINDLIDRMRRRNVVIRFPKMDLKNKVNLKEAIEALGTRSVFMPNEANFGVMLDVNTVLDNTWRNTTINCDSKMLQKVVDSISNPGLYVNSILHEVRIKIYEYGTEAVAATSAVTARTAELFYANSPFYMFIRNERTKLVTFSAVIVDPTS